MKPSNLKRLSKVYNDRLAWIEEYVEFVDNFEPEKHRAETTSQLTALEETKKEYENARERLLLEDDEVDDVKLRSDRKEFFKKYHKVRGFLLDYQGQQEHGRPQANSTMANTTYSAVKMRLPKLELPSFNGEITQWVTFKDRFTSLVHDVLELSDVMKLQYLLSSLKGNAALQFEHVPLDDKSYAPTWQALLNRYDDDKLLKREYFKALVHLEPMSAATAVELTRIVNETRRLVQGMERLEEPTKHWNTPLTSLVMYKLERNTLMAWEQFSAEQSNDTYDKLLEFCEKRIRILSSTALHQSNVIETKAATRSTHQRGRFMPQEQQVARGRMQGATKCQLLPVSVSYAAQSNPLPSKLCPVCNDHHQLANCVAFEKLSVAEREEVVKREGLCFSCLKQNHRIRFCKSSMRCSQCNGRHHTMLCKGQQDAMRDININAATHDETKMKNLVWLSTALVLVRNEQGVEHPVRALIDQGSQSNFISERLTQQLKLRKKSILKPLSGIGSVSVFANGMVSAQIKSRVSDYQTTLNFLVLPRVTADFPSRYSDISKWSIPTEVALADPLFFKPERIDLLIGAEVFGELLEQGRITLANHLPSLLQTKLGWIVCGRMTERKMLATGGVIAGCAIDTEFQSAMERLIKLEDIPEEKVPSPEEIACEEGYNKTTRRNGEGRYIVQLPKVPNFEKQLGESYDNAVRRFEAVERRMKRDLMLHKEYQQFMGEYEKLGHMSRVVGEEIGMPCYYLPHHAVWKPGSTTTKCRVVFDASSKTSSGRSLNEVLLVGPQLQDDIVSILLRFRLHKVAMVADVEKMYRQVLVEEDDRRLQLILWRSSESEPIGTYRLNTVTYGTACAPYLAVRTLRRAFEDSKSEFPEAMAWFNDFYVDDLISGAESTKRAEVIRRQLVELLARAGFKLRKWASNKAAALDGLPDEDIATVEEHELADEGSLVNTLGLIWKPRSDELKVRVPAVNNANVVTKRNVTSVIARMYDPFGIMDPVKMLAKIFLQRIWMLKDVNGRAWPWDKELPGGMQGEWLDLVKNLHLLENISIPRLMTLGDNVQYHIFCDASERGYGACMYLRSTTAAGKSTVYLVVSKSKVRPLAKQLTIAKLELCAAVLGSRLWSFTRKARLTDAPCFLWTDSMTAWHWIQSPHYLWKTFVANRTAKIQSLTEGCIWRHVPGVENPADLVSRGCEPARFVTNTLWWSGPSWLQLSEESWPVMSSDRIETTDEEKKTVALVSSETEESFGSYLFSRFSSFTKLRRVMGYVLRYLQRLRMRTTKMTMSTDYMATILTTDELKKAEEEICRIAQHDCFPEEAKLLQQKRHLPRRSALFSLNVILDDHGLIRMRGRLANSSLSSSTKHPIVLAKDHQLATLLANYYHLRMLHAGPQLTVTAIRQRFWIFGARSLLRKICRQCVRCCRTRPSLVIQPMGDLPASRVTEARPFAVSGVDYCGPVYVKGSHRRAAPTKAYVAVFVCFATRAVHLELVSSLSTQAFLAALRRFTSRRGMVAELNSDNGTNFKGASNELRELYDMMRAEEFQNTINTWCTEQGFVWKFIPPGAPHFGGLWEAAVRAMKHHLRRVIGDRALSYEDLTTFLTQVESCLNSRPITPLSDDPLDMEALTPGHFLTGSNMQQLPEVNLKEIPENRLNHWRIVQQRLQHFWTRWQTEYLQNLQSRTKWNVAPKQIKTGMMVIIKEENVPPSKWALGRIIEVYPGKDGIVRVAMIRTKNNDRVKRPVAKLCILPINE